MRILWVACLAACNGPSTNIKSTLKFADRTDAEIARLVNSAGGADLFTAESIVESYGSPTMSDPCPNVTSTTTEAIVTGGCTTKDGTMIMGSASVVNPIGFDNVPYAYGADTVYTLDNFTLVNAQITQIYSGSLRNKSFLIYDGDITTTLLDVAVRGDIYYECSQSDRTCEVSGSGVELVGVGGATVSGKVQIAQNNSTSGSFTLRGADTLTVHITQSCVAWQISGTDRAKTCP